jgi:aryl-alcohol dehydrogenase-like predicted oxidoreductase
MNLILGPAMWGWTTPKNIAFDLLDYFYANGFREVDSATNYPINKKPEDFRASEKILEEWIRVNGVSDLKILMKIGSLNNMRTPDHNLTKSFLLMNLDDYKFRFGKNLDTIMVHWDNRDSKAAIKDTFEAFQLIHNQGFKVGFSGVKFPEIYSDLNQKFGLDFRVQIKHNLLQSDYEKYRMFHDKKRFIPYGINGGGLKLNPQKYHDNSSLKVRGGKVDEIHPLVGDIQKILPKWNEKLADNSISTFNELAMIYAFHSPNVEGILIGPSKLSQLQNTVSIFESLKSSDFYKEIYAELAGLSKNYR